MPDQRGNNFCEISEVWLGIEVSLTKELLNSVQNSPYCFRFLNILLCVWLILKYFCVNINHTQNSSNCFRYLNSLQCVWLILKYFYTNINHTHVIPNLLKHFP